jgi:integrase
MRGNPQNHPKFGATITVEPIRDPKDIDAIKKLLQGSPRDLLLFSLGVNNGLRTGDLLKLRVGQVRNLKPGQSISIREGKTGKQNVLMINKCVHRALQGYWAGANPKDSDFLFASRTGSGSITIQRVNQLVKSWTKSIHLEGNYGAHSLRKTFGYVQRTRFGIGFEIIARRFNHSSPSITMRYLGIQSDEVNGILLNEI